MAVLLFQTIVILIIMKKEKHLRIRLSEPQMKQLIQTITNKEKMTKSEFVRQAIMDKIKKYDSNENRRSK